ncbi:hypothetical protein B0O99DRAFT_648579 [Bisporella sp. PMI_857]|nr:hypothetical protein B0O99DRAFT_648579 [Bisporella sp. PMI_857]
MPPQISDDEVSDTGSAASETSEKPIVTTEKESKIVKEETVMTDGINDNADEKGDEGEDEDISDIGEDEYVVEKITNHMVDEDGTLKFEVKWEGYEKKSDRTWEPEENLSTANKILNEYLDSIGGKEPLLSAWKEKKALAEEKKGKKRARASTTGDANGSAKKGRKSGHPASGTPPVATKQAEFKPPSGSWEEDVVGIDACEGPEGAVIVYLTWKGGQKTQHPTAQVYKRCPQRMLKFYESHLVFRKNDDADDS